MKRRDESRKTVRKNFRYIECDAFAEYLHDMSLQGWHFCGQRSFCIFRRIDEDAVPIVTEEERLENIFRAERKALLSELTSRSFLTLVFWREFLGNQFEDWNFSDARLLLLLFCTAMAAYRLCKIAALYILHTRCRRKTAAGVPVYYGRRNAVR